MNPKDSVAHHNKGLVYHAVGQYPEAVRAFNEGLFFDRNNREIMASRALSLAKLGKHREALGALEEAKRLGREDGGLLKAQAMVHLEAGQPREALNPLEGALRVDPKDLELWLLKADALEKLGRDDEALNILEEALKVDYDDREVWLHKAALHAKRGEHHVALGCLDRAVEIDAEDGRIWLMRGSMLEATEDIEGALVCYDRALELGPKDTAAHLAKGRCLSRQGRFEAALKALDEGLRLDPNLEEAQRVRKATEERMRRSRVEAYARKALEFEYANARAASPEELVKLCNVPLPLVEEVATFINEPIALDPSHLPPGERRELEEASSQLLAQWDGRSGRMPPLAELAHLLPDREVGDLRAVLGYIGAVNALPLGAPGEADQALLRKALELPEGERTAPGLAKHLGVGAYKARTLEAALHSLGGSVGGGWRVATPKGRAPARRIPGPPPGLDNPGRTEGGHTSEHLCRRHGKPGSSQHRCGQYLCSECLRGTSCPICHLPLRERKATPFVEVLGPPERTTAPVPAEVPAGEATASTEARPEVDRDFTRL
jgi:tetratricopeptide (TPR) repeat protein